MLAAASLCIVMSAASFADTRLSIQHTEVGEEEQTQSVMVTSGKVRMEQGAMDDTVLLYHQATNTFYAIQPSQKSYMEFDPIEEILENPQLAKLPIVRAGSKATAGYEPDAWKEWISAAE